MTTAEPTLKDFFKKIPPMPAKMVEKEKKFVHLGSPDLEREPELKLPINIPEEFIDDEEDEWTIPRRELMNWIENIGEAM